MGKIIFIIRKGSIILTEFTDREADLMYLKLLHRLAKLHLKEKKIQMKGID